MMIPLFLYRLICLDFAMYMIHVEFFDLDGNVVLYMIQDGYRISTATFRVRNASYIDCSVAAFQLV